MQMSVRIKCHECDVYSPVHDSKFSNLVNKQNATTTTGIFNIKSTDTIIHNPVSQ